jgi:hypothetical protein
LSVSIADGLPVLTEGTYLDLETPCSAILMARNQAVSTNPAGFTKRSPSLLRRESILEKDYPERKGLSGIKGLSPMIYLVDSFPSLLSAMSEKAQQYAYDNFMKMGVEVHLNKHIKD